MTKKFRTKKVGIIAICVAVLLLAGTGAYAYTASRSGPVISHEVLEDGTHQFTASIEGEGEDFHGAVTVYMDDDGNVEYTVDWSEENEVFVMDMFEVLERLKAEYGVDEIATTVELDENGNMIFKYSVDNGITWNPVDAE